MDVCRKSFQHDVWLRGERWKRFWTMSSALCVNCISYCSLTQCKRGDWNPKEKIERKFLRSAFEIDTEVHCLFLGSNDAKSFFFSIEIWKASRTVWASFIFWGWIRWCHLWDQKSHWWGRYTSVRLLRSNIILVILWHLCPCCLL